MAAGIVWLIAAGWFGFATWQDLRALEQIAAEPSVIKDLSQLRQQTRAARRDTFILQRLAQPLTTVTPLFRGIPKYGGDLAYAGDLLALAADISEALDEALAAGATMFPIDVSAGDLPQRVLAALPEAGPHLAAALAAGEQAQVVRERISLESLSPSVARRVQRVDKYLPLLRAGLGLAQALPELLGAQQTRTYLLLAQNQDELRATGGFISGAGTVTLDQGRVTDLVMEDAYTVDDLSHGPYPSPPEDFAAYMGGNVWLLRDANWSPDFPAAAQTAAQLYELGRGKKVDGVIAFDQTLLQKVLAALGPVSVSDTPEAIGADNVIPYMRAAWSTEPGQGISPEWYARRKAFMGALARAMLDKLMSTRDPAILAAFSRALLNCLQERHLLIELRNPAAAAELQRAGWDGAIHPDERDYWMIVDSNLGFNKVNPLIEERLNYTVDLTVPEEPIATLAIDYRSKVAQTVSCQHEASYGTGQYADLMQRCYWDYWRVLLPAGAEMMQVPQNHLDGDQILTGHANHDPAQVGTGPAGTAQVSGIFVLSPGGQEELKLSYRLPITALALSEGQAVYRLSIQKQAGTTGLPLSLSLLYPPGWRLRSASTAPSETFSGRVNFDLTLRTDVEVEISFDRPRNDSGR